MPLTAKPVFAGTLVPEDVIENTSDARRALVGSSPTFSRIAFPLSSYQLAPGRPSSIVFAYSLRRSASSAGVLTPSGAPTIFWPSALALLMLRVLRCTTSGPFFFGVTVSSDAFAATFFSAPFVTFFVAVSAASTPAFVATLLAPRPWGSTPATARGTIAASFFPPTSLPRARSVAACLKTRYGSASGSMNPALSSRRLSVIGAARMSLPSLRSQSPASSALSVMSRTTLRGVDFTA